MSRKKDVNARIQFETIKWIAMNGYHLYINIFKPAFIVKDDATYYLG